MSNNKKEKVWVQKSDPHVSKAYVLTILIFMWIGVALCICSWLDFSVFGLFSVKILGIVGGVLAIATVFILLLTVQCPYCGKKKIGRAMGVSLKKNVECPDCHENVEIR